MKKNKYENEQPKPLKLRHACYLGKYRLDKRLAIGGSGEVWKARDSIEGTWGALKIPLAGEKGLRDHKTLLKEVRLVAKLRHDNILPIKNADIIDGHLVVARELSAGTLEDCTKPMAPKRLLWIIEQVLKGLCFAHNNRVVHCDVSPSNIFLFNQGRAMLGDFGISLQIKGKMKTVDDFGTPGYVAPEQAYGRPTYRSDCFSLALIIYQYITGVLPRWPFNWPPKGYERLRKKTSLNFVKLMRKALSVEPGNRFANACRMLDAMHEAMPKVLRSPSIPEVSQKKDWKKIRRQNYLRKYKRTLPDMYKCHACGEPVSERMLFCPWCGTKQKPRKIYTRYNYACPRCGRGVLAEWRFCPWCYGAGFSSVSEKKTPGIRYQKLCRYCGGGLLRFMRYCPSCRRKVNRNWHVRPFPEVCTRCNWPVDSSFWNHCPWCAQSLF